jgi:hypothetical protein
MVPPGPVLQGRARVRAGPPLDKEKAAPRETARAVELRGNVEPAHDAPRTGVRQGGAAVRVRPLGRRVTRTPCRALLGRRRTVPGTDPGRGSARADAAGRPRTTTRGG